MAKKGYKMTEEHKFKISQSHKARGHLHWMKKPEVREKVSITKKLRSHKPWLGKKRPNISGENHYLWNGKTPLVEQIRKCLEYRNWRSEVFERDYYSCKDCGVSGVYLHADHIKQFAFILRENKIMTMEQALDCKELWDISNGRTLCIPCHRKIPVFSYDGSRRVVFNKSYNYIY